MVKKECSLAEISVYNSFEEEKEAFYSWESSYALHMIRVNKRENFSLNEPGFFLSKNYFPQNALRIIEVADRWHMRFKEIKEFVINGDIKVFPGWHYMGRFENDDVKLKPMLFVSNEDIAHIETSRPQLYAEAQRWHEITEVYNLHKENCNNASVFYMELPQLYSSRIKAPPIHNLFRCARCKGKSLISRTDKNDRKDKDAHIAELETQLAASTAEPAMLTRTQAATETRQEKILESWQAAFKSMVPIILQCHADGPKKRTRAEIQSMCHKHGGELTKTQRDFLRECLKECLGEDHVNTDGGPPSQG